MGIERHVCSIHHLEPGPFNHLTPKCLMYSTFLRYVTHDMLLQLFFLISIFLSSDSWFLEDRDQVFLIPVSQEHGIVSGTQQMPLKCLSEWLKFSHSQMPILVHMHSSAPSPHVGSIPWNFSHFFPVHLLSHWIT